MSINNIDRQLSITPQSNITDHQAADEVMQTAKNPFHGKTLKLLSHVPLSQHPSIVENYAKKTGVHHYLTQFIDSLARRFNKDQHSEELMLVKSTPLKNRKITVG